jgi:hypothetical protein
MTLIHRFRGAGTSLLLLVALVLLGGWVGLFSGEPDPSNGLLKVPIFRFEKEAVTGFEINRPDRQIAMQKDGERWVVDGETWRPSRSMIRRVAHQLHDLTARATVVDAPEDYGRYGLGEGAITVFVSLDDGRTLAFEAGDPNPTAVSYYLRPIPGERVYVVKKSAVDFFRSDLEAYREHKFAIFDAGEVDALVARVDGRRLAVERTGPHSWQMSEPLVQRASRDKVRMMLGRISTLKAQTFVEDDPPDLGRYGMDPPTATVEVRTNAGEPISLVFGDLVPDSDPIQRYVYRVEDEAVYAVKEGMLEPFSMPAEAYRNRILLGKQAWQVSAMQVSLQGVSIAVTRTADDWRWPDGQAIAGSTPERVAGRAANVRAEDFLVSSTNDAGLKPWATVALSFDDDTTGVVSLGPKREVSGEDGSEMRHDAWIDGDPSTYAVNGDLASVILDLHREFDRKRERDAEQQLRLAPP